MNRLTIDVRPGDYSLAWLRSGARVPADLFDVDERALVSVTSTAEGITVVCPTEREPEARQVERGWRLLTVRGPLEFTLTGIMAALAGSLAAAGISLYALSTFDTDHILVKAADVQRAVVALREAGHEVHA